MSFPLSIKDQYRELIQEIAKHTKEKATSANVEKALDFYLEHIRSMKKRDEMLNEIDRLNKENIDIKKKFNMIIEMLRPIMETHMKNGDFNHLQPDYETNREFYENLKKEKNNKLN